MGIAVIVLRSMDRSDLDAVAEMERSHQPRPWSRGVFEDELDAVGRVYLVAEADGSAVGFGGLMLVGDEAHVTNLLVDGQYRRRGIGRRLVSALIEAAVAEGARHITLEVRASNEAARSLYQTFGLAPVGVRPGYYGDEDALIFWAHDIDRPGYAEPSE